jgi:hypothetical protein
MNQGAVARWHAAQSRLLSETYDRSWRQGVASYEPDEDPAPRSTPTNKNEGPAPALVAGAGLLARRARAYHAPAQPEETAKAEALGPAANGLRRMAGELLTLTPTAEHVGQGAALARTGELGMEEIGAHAEALALDEWLAANEARLAGGDSVAWAGEQRGYAEAADADGQLLEWLPEADERVCEDCEGLGDLPPMPLSDFPTTPGSGDTACSVGCRCVLQVADDQTLGPGGESTPLTESQEDMVSEIAERREPTDWQAALPAPPPETRRLQESAREAVPDLSAAVRVRNALHPRRVTFRARVRRLLHRRQ